MATVRIDDNLSARKTRISLRSADDEAAGRLNVEDGLVVEQVRRDDGLDNLLHKLLLQVGRRDFLGVLGRDDDRVDAAGNERAVRLLFILDGDLGLRVGAEPAELSRATEVGHLLVELVREHEGDRHQLRGFCEVGSWRVSFRHRDPSSWLDATLRDAGKLTVGGVTEHDTLRGVGR